MTAQPKTADLIAGASAVPAEIAAAEILPLAEAGPLWRQLESSGALAGSPYQRYDWVRAYADALAGPEGFAPVAVLLRDPAGVPVALLPLAIGRRAGLTVATSLGGKQANLHLPLLAPPGRAPSPETMRTALVGLARSGRLRVDAFAFCNVPAAWCGAPNPLALGGVPSPSDVHRLTLDASPDILFTRTYSGESRKKLRRKERALAELGPLSATVAATEGEAEEVLATFFRLKADRFQELGITDPFAAPGVKAFIRSAALGDIGGRPAIELHALRVGERIAAVFGAAVDGERCCGMFNAFDPAPDLARSSPGELLLQAVIRHQHAVGRKVFDLGVGEARYKSALCPEVERLVEVTWPVTWRGRLWVAVSRAAVALKRRVKRTPWLMRLAARALGRRAPA